MEAELAGGGGQLMAEALRIADHQSAVDSSNTGEISVGMEVSQVTICEACERANFRHERRDLGVWKSTPCAFLIEDQCEGLALK